MTNRIKRACHTNEPQSMMVLLLTGINLLAYLIAEDSVPLAMWLVAVVFWPTFAFVFNLIDPIPNDQEQKQ